MAIPCKWAKKEKEEKLFGYDPMERPYLAKETPITDLESFCKRVDELKACIKSCNGNIDWVSGKLKQDKVADVYGGIWDLLNDEDTKAIDEVLRKRLNAYIEQQKDLIHSCEDELDWLEMKMGVKENTGALHRDYNFDITKDHA